MGARDCSAFSTASMILPKTVSAPSRSVLTSSMPDWLVVPANTAAPGSFSTGTDSPVMLDWSTVEWPATTTPSTGISAPGRMTTTSPGSHLGNGQFLHGFAAPDQGCLGKQVQQILNGLPPAIDGQLLQDLGSQDEEENEKGGGELADGQGRRQRDGHG